MEDLPCFQWEVEGNHGRVIHRPQNLCSSLLKGVLAGIIQIKDGKNEREEIIMIIDKFNQFLYDF